MTRSPRTWLDALTATPTCAGREDRVVRWIEAWVNERDDLQLKRDAAGNLTVEPRTPWGSGRSDSAPLFITAHMDHPAFIVERALGPQAVELAFRGGVRDAYFENARICVHGESGARIGGTVVEAIEGAKPFKRYIAEFDAEADIRPGDIATWELPEPELTEGGVYHTHACDDLAAVCAALGAYDVLRERSDEASDVRLLFTRAEEIGFLGTIGACRDETVPAGARVIVLENSRAFAESPVGAGPIVRVGDRMSVFDPGLTAWVASVAGGVASRKAEASAEGAREWRWQRKLMAGGACEASVFCTYGYRSTCLCLPLGNYHNMGNLSEVEAGRGPARIEREYISLADFDGLIDLLAACGTDAPREGSDLRVRLAKLWEERRGILSKAEGQGRKAKGRHEDAETR